MILNDTRNHNRISTIYTHNYSCHDNTQQCSNHVTYNTWSRDWPSIVASPQTFLSKSRGGEIIVPELTQLLQWVQTYTSVTDMLNSHTQSSDVLIGSFSLSSTEHPWVCWALSVDYVCSNTAMLFFFLVFLHCMHCCVIYNRGLQQYNILELESHRHLNRWAWIALPVQLTGHSKLHLKALILKSKQ